jgi:hypothetical protein
MKMPMDEDQAKQNKNNIFEFLFFLRVGIPVGEK